MFLCFQIVQRLLHLNLHIVKLTLEEISYYDVSLEVSPHPL
jgi:hypothetical protein